MQDQLLTIRVCALCEGKPQQTFIFLSKRGGKLSSGRLSVKQNCTCPMCVLCLPDQFPAPPSSCSAVSFHPRGTDDAFTRPHKEPVIGRRYIRPILIVNSSGHVGARKRDETVEDQRQTGWKTDKTFRSFDIPICISKPRC